MTTRYKAAEVLAILGDTMRSKLFLEKKRHACWTARSAIAFLLAALLGVGPLSPVFAQAPAQNPPSSPAPAATAQSQETAVAPVSSLGLAKHDFTRGPRTFPDILKAYAP